MAQTSSVARPGPIDRLPLWAILLSCAVIVGLAMGLRQSIGLFMTPVSSDLGLGREVFSLAVGISNITWGIAAPFTGAVADKYGSGRVVVFGAICTALGLGLLYLAISPAAIAAATPVAEALAIDGYGPSAIILLASGFLLGLGVAGAGINALVGAVGRAAPPEQRTQAVATLGIGSGIGILVAIPYVSQLIDAFTWQQALIYIIATTAIMLPLAWTVSGAPSTQTGPTTDRAQSLGEALREAFAHPSFWLLNAGFFVCGFHVVFYGTHLPAYVGDQGFESWVSVAGLVAVGVGNLFGTYLSGQWGKRGSKRLGLSFIYTGRAIIFLGFLFLPITPTTIIVLSALLGLFWLSTIPLTSSLVAVFYGPVWMTTLYGIVFFSHQVGSFLGVYMAGVLYDETQSYDLMWWISVGLGIFAAIIHLPIRERPVARLAARAAAA